MKGRGRRERSAPLTNGRAAAGIPAAGIAFVMHVSLTIDEAHRRRASGEAIEYAVEIPVADRDGAQRLGQLTSQVRRRRGGASAARAVSGGALPGGVARRQKGRLSALGAPSVPRATTPTGSGSAAGASSAVSFGSAPPSIVAAARPPPSNSTCQALNVTASRFLSSRSVHSRQSSTASTTTRAPLRSTAHSCAPGPPNTSTVK